LFNQAKKDDFMPIPIALTIVKLATAVVKLKPFIFAVGGKVVAIASKMGSITRFLSLKARPILGFFGKIFRPIFGWAAKLFPWIAAAIAPQLAERLVQATQQAWHFNWKISDKALQQGIKDAITNLYEPLGEFIGRSVATVLVGRGLGGNNIPKVRINTGQLARLVELSGGNEVVRDSLIDAVTDIWFSVKTAAESILFNYLFLNARKFAEQQTGQELGGEKEDDSFVFAEKFEENIKEIFPDENVSSAVINGFETFFDTLGELLTEDEMYAEFI